MKLWHIVKGTGVNATYNLCGYPIYKIKEKLNIRERIFCKGLLSSKKTFCYEKGISLKEFFVFKKCFLKRGIYKYRAIVKLFGLTLQDQEEVMAFYKKYKSKIPADTDYLCFLSTGIGEFSLFLSLCLNNFMKQNHIKHPLFITKNKYHIALLNIFCPSLKIILVLDFPFQRVNEFKINNIRAKYFFPLPYFQQVEKDIHNKRIHFGESLLNFFELNNKKFDVNLPKILSKWQYTTEEKLKPFSLNNKDFVFISPQANSCQRINIKFWNTLVEKLHNKGLKIIFNSSDFSVPPGCLTADFSLKEAFVIAQKAKAIIGVRSGLLDLLSMSETPIHAIYTAFKDRKDFPPMSKEYVRIGFDLEKLPKEIRKSKIYSYFYSENLIEEILNNL
ncbi:MAG: hypothetical protein IKP23_00285 [Elusimicrobiaceae bacterium]|nr:hypothetical protein [Elusimicrobiaceae bacterium]